MITIRDYVKQRQYKEYTKFNESIDEQLEKADIFEEEVTFFFIEEQYSQSADQIIPSQRDFCIVGVRGIYKNYEWYKLPLTTFQLEFK